MFYLIGTYLILINLIGYFIMYYDKRKAVKGQWRVSEVTLITIAIVGGSIGSYFGMQNFRHKTKHIKFKLGIPVIIIVQAIVVFSFLK